MTNRRQEFKKAGGQAINGRSEDRRVIRYAGICEQSSQDTCHCQRVKRPSQSHNSEISSVIFCSGTLPIRTYSLIDLLTYSLKSITLPLYSPPLKGGDIEFLPLLGKVRMGFKQTPLTLTLSRRGRGKSIRVLSRAKVNSPGRGDYINSLKRTYSPIDLLTSSLKKKLATFTIADGATRVVLLNGQRRAAFTLAEVLITLGIIGVVAAMTLPTLITKHQKDETVTKLKRAYTLTNQAIIMAEIKHGEMENWQDWNSPEKIVNNYLAPEFKIDKTYPPGDYAENMCYNGKMFYENTQYEWLTGVWLSSPINPGTASFKTVDGVCIGLYSTSINNAAFFIDINGSDKGPNVAGKDLFFFILADKMLKPYGYDWPDNTINSTASWACNAKAVSGGYTCAAKIMRDGWQIKDDYPF